MTDSVALVTGASRGIGQAIAARLAEDGFFVVGTATSQAGAQRIGDYLGENGRGLVLDVGDADSIETLQQVMVEDYGALSVLVNNAGITQDNLLLRMKDEEWQRVIDTNLTSVYRLCKVFLRGMMKARFGRIINVTSVVALTGNAGQCNYSASKAGMIGLTKSLAQEVGSRGITVNAVAPGFIDTDMTRDLPEANKNALLASIPLARLGKGEEIAHAVAFLASPNAGYITGETVHVNGGLFMA